LPVALFVFSREDFSTPLEFFSKPQNAARTFPLFLYFLASLHLASYFALSLRTVFPGNLATLSLKFPSTYLRIMD
jgi:hypothetical protein